MRSLISEAFKIIYKVTGNEIIALLVSILYISLLNLITIYGLGLCFENWLYQLAAVHAAFSFPYIIAPIGLVLGYNIWSVLPLTNLSSQLGEYLKPRTLIIYSLVCIVLGFYIQIHIPLY